jgi:hypothetical protein
MKSLALYVQIPQEELELKGLTTGISAGFER